MEVKLNTLLKDQVHFTEVETTVGNVYLFRVNDNMFQAGRTCCEIPDATDTNQTLCVNICESVNYLTNS